MGDETCGWIDSDDEIENDDKQFLAKKEQERGLLYNAVTSFFILKGEPIWLSFFIFTLIGVCETPKAT